MRSRVATIVNCCWSRPCRDVVVTGSPVTVCSLFDALSFATHYRAKLNPYSTTTIGTSIQLTLNAILNHST